MRFGAPTPILRIFDEAKAREFYLDWLGFQVDFEHRFEPGAPLYLGISRGAARLNLSEHHGDGSPGTYVRIEVPELEAYHAELTAKPYRYYRPGLQDQEWGTRECVVGDPFHNKLVFYRPLALRAGEVEVEIVRFVDADQPGWVECRLVDADGRTWTFREKVPIVTTAPLDERSAYPRRGAIACEILRADGDVVTIDTTRPSGVEATTGATRFRVRVAQLVG